MAQHTPIQIFRPGTHVAMSGDALSFSESDLQATARAYDPALHEAPIVVGHPTHDGPAYGWVKALAFADGALDAAPHQVNPDFAELVRSGAFKKVSASFYAPDSPQNPVPGVYYLRHVGFLGAQPPAVKGLRQPAFADGEVGVVEFSEWGDVQNASLWRRLREWMIGRFGMDEADNTLPGYAVQTLEEEAQRELAEEAAAAEAESGPGAAPVALPTAFADPAHSPIQPQEASAVTPEEKAALEAENAQLKQRLAEAEARDKETRQAAIHAANAAFAEGLVGEGRLLPVEKEVAVAALDHLALADTPVEFGEGENKKPLGDGLKALFAALPKRVEFGEVAGGAVEGSGKGGRFAAPDGFAVDGEGLALHQAALSYAEQRKVDYVTAVRAVSAHQ